MHPFLILKTNQGIILDIQPQEEFGKLYSWFHSVDLVFYNRRAKESF